MFDVALMMMMMNFRVAVLNGHEVAGLNYFIQLSQPTSLCLYQQGHEQFR